MTVQCLNNSQHLHLTFLKCCLSVLHSFLGANRSADRRPVRFGDQWSLVSHMRTIKRKDEFRKRLSGTLTPENERAWGAFHVNGETFISLNGQRRVKTKHPHKLFSIVRYKRVTKGSRTLQSPRVWMTRLSARVIFGKIVQKRNRKFKCKKAKGKVHPKKKITLLFTRSLCHSKLNLEYKLCEDFSKMFPSVFQWKSFIHVLSNDELLGERLQTLDVFLKESEMNFSIKETLHFFWK